MKSMITTVELADLPQILQERINRDVDHGYVVLNIEKTEIPSANDRTHVEFQVKLNNEGLFVEHRLYLPQHRNAEADDIHSSYFTASDILFYISANTNLFKRVEKLISKARQS